MKVKEHLSTAGRFLWTRLSEPSTWKGLVLIAAAWGWWDLDNTSKGEAIAQIGLLVYGVINAGLSQKVLYGGKPND